MTTGRGDQDSEAATVEAQGRHEPLTEQPTLAGRPDAAEGGKAPTTIGDYRILGLLGQGGMGTVYRAEQKDPRRIVALKVIRGGRFVDASVVKMFKREVDSLARLRHPSIAAIYEAGCTTDGQHFFAMELVEGETLDDYLRKRPAPRNREEITARLILFRRICDAVSYAHQRGIIHRDLKPSNVLVNAREATSSAADQPEVKVLDFGLARMTETDVSATTTTTDIGTVKGTLPYMSPEQARGRAGDVDVRTDIYALGIILFEMLTARRPYSLDGITLLEAIRVICEAPPARLGGGPTDGIAFDDDLETITGKALEKDADQRYSSVAALSEDVGRYLQRQPILAHPPSAVYQLRKLVGRHRLAFGLGVAAVAALAAVSVVTSALYSRAERNLARALQAEQVASQEARTARSVSDFLVGVFEVSNPSEARGRTITARELLDQGSDRVQRDLRDQPATQARLMTTIGAVYASLGLYAEAEPILAQALAVGRGVHGERHAEVADTMAQLGHLRWQQGRYPEAEPILRTALAVREQILGLDSLEVASTLVTLATVYKEEARLREAEPLFQRALAIRERALGAQHPLVAETLNSLADQYWGEGRYDEASSLYERALAIREKSLAPDHPGLARNLNNLGNLYAEQGKRARAEAMYLRAMAIWEKSLGPEHPDVASVLANLAVLNWEEKKYAEAERRCLRALAIREKALPPNHPDIGDSLNNLGAIYFDVGKYPQAESAYRRALAVRERSLGPKHYRVATTLFNLGELYGKQGKYDRAEPLCWRALAITEEGLGPMHPNLTPLLTGMASLLTAEGKYVEAEPLYRRALAIEEKALGADNRLLSPLLLDYAALLRRMGKTSEGSALEARARQLSAQSAR